MFFQAGCWELEPSEGMASRWLVSFGALLGVDRSGGYFGPISVYRAEHFVTVWLSSKDLYSDAIRKPEYTALLYSIELQYLGRVLFSVSFPAEQTFLARQAIAFFDGVPLRLLYPLRFLSRSSE